MNQPSSTPTVNIEAPDAGRAKKPIGRRVDEAYRSILKLIQDGGLTEGDRLPSEANMAVRFGVSRPVVRQALSRLQQAGIIEIRWGAGTYVAGGIPHHESPVFKFGDVRSLEEVRYTFEVRRGIEAEVAALAATRATPADIETIESTFLLLNAALRDLEPSQDLDIAFHFAIAQAAHNPFYEQLMRAVRIPILRCAAIAKLLTQEVDLPARSQLIMAEHEAILVAIVARDPVASRQAAQRHVDEAFKRVSCGV